MSYENALLTANRLSDETWEAAGALYTQSGHLVPESLRRVDRTDPWKVVNPERIPRPSTVVGRHAVDGVDFYLDEGILAGHLLAGWGHLITETISTAWASEQLPDAPLILVPWGRMWVSAFPRIMETLRLAGWDERRVVVATGEMALGKVHVPERLVDIRGLMDEGKQIDPALNVVYDRMIARSVSESSPKRKIFFPRPQGHRRAHPNEAAIEQALVDDGYVSVQGWDMSVREQVAAVNSASALVAFSGSNLHNSVFAERGVPVVEIMDSRAQHDAAHGRTRLQRPLCNLREQPFAEVDGFRDGQPRDVADIISDVTQLAGSDTLVSEGADSSL